MKIKITGINGYVGQLLAKQLQENDYLVSGINRKLLYGPIKYLKEEIRGCDVLINLAGAPIMQRWTTKNKATIYNSRIETTHKLVKAIKELSNIERPKKFISASAIGIYKCGDSHNERSTNFENRFVGTVVKDWENELFELPDAVATVIFRVGLVLGKEAKTIKNLILPFKLGLGGKIGSGKQAFPFIHETDLRNAFVWAVESIPAQRIYNTVAPQQISNNYFTKTLANKLNQPAIFTIPSFLLKIFLGKTSTLLLESPTVSPQNLIDENFSFKYPTIDDALSEILGIKKPRP